MSLDIQRKKLDIVKAQAAIAELEYKIMERHEDIKRMEDHIGLQLKLISEKESELDKLLNK